jgi:hypothetical protein
MTRQWWTRLAVFWRSAIFSATSRGQFHRAARGLGRRWRFWDQARAIERGDWLLELGHRQVRWTDANMTSAAGTGCSASYWPLVRAASTTVPACPAAATRVIFRLASIKSVSSSSHAGESSVNWGFAPRKIGVGRPPEFGTSVHQLTNLATVCHSRCLKHRRGLFNNVREIEQYAVQVEIYLQDASEERWRAAYHRRCGKRTQYVEPRGADRNRRSVPSRAHAPMPKHLSARCGAIRSSPARDP